MCIIVDFTPVQDDWHLSQTGKLRDIFVSELTSCCSSFNFFSSNKWYFVHFVHIVHMYYYYLRSEDLLAEHAFSLNIIDIKNQHVFNRVEIKFCYSTQYIFNITSVLNSFFRMARTRMRTISLLSNIKNYNKYCLSNNLNQRHQTILHGTWFETQVIGWSRLNVFWLQYITIFIRYQTETHRQRLISITHKQLKNKLTQ